MRAEGSLYIGLLNSLYFVHLFGIPQTEQLHLRYRIFAGYTGGTFVTKLIPLPRIRISRLSAMNHWILIRFEPPENLKTKYLSAIRLNDGSII
jgi:hypothetical protein